MTPSDDLDLLDVSDDVFDVQMALCMLGNVTKDGDRTASPMDITHRFITHPTHVSFTCQVLRRVKDRLQAGLTTHRFFRASTSAGRRHRHWGVTAAFVLRTPALRAVCDVTLSILPPGSRPRCEGSRQGDTRLEGEGVEGWSYGEKAVSEGCASAVDVAEPRSGPCGCKAGLSHDEWEGRGDEGERAEEEKGRTDGDRRGKLERGNKGQVEEREDNASTGIASETDPKEKTRTDEGSWADEDETLVCGILNDTPVQNKSTALKRFSLGVYDSAIEDTMTSFSEANDSDCNDDCSKPRRFPSGDSVQSETTSSSKSCDPYDANPPCDASAPCDVRTSRDVRTSCDVSISRSVSLDSLGSSGSSNVDSAVWSSEDDRGEESSEETEGDDCDTRPAPGPDVSGADRLVAVDQRQDQLLNAIRWTGFQDLLNVLRAHAEEEGYPSAAGPGVYVVQDLVDGPGDNAVCDAVGDESPGDINHNAKAAATTVFEDGAIDHWFNSSDMTEQTRMTTKTTFLDSHTDILGDFDDRLDKPGTAKQCYTTRQADTTPTTKVFENDPGLNVFGIQPRASDIIRQAFLIATTTSSDDDSDLDVPEDNLHPSDIIRQAFLIATTADDDTADDMHTFPNTVNLHTSSESSQPLPSDAGDADEDGQTLCLSSPKYSYVASCGDTFNDSKDSGSLQAHTAEGERQKIEAKSLGETQDELLKSTHLVQFDLEKSLMPFGSCENDPNFSRYDSSYGCKARAFAKAGCDSGGLFEWTPLKGDASRSCSNSSSSPPSPTCRRKGRSQKSNESDLHSLRPKAISASSSSLEAETAACTCIEANFSSEDTDSFSQIHPLLVEQRRCVKCTRLSDQCCYSAVKDCPTDKSHCSKMQDVYVDDSAARSSFEDSDHTTANASPYSSVWPFLNMPIIPSAQLLSQIIDESQEASRWLEEHSDDSNIPFPFDICDDSNSLAFARDF